MGQKLAHGVMGLYKYSNGKICLADFRQPVGMHLKEDNRRVKNAQTIKIALRKQFSAKPLNRKGKQNGNGCVSKI